MKSICPICNRRSISLAKKIRLALSGRKHRFVFGIEETNCPHCGNILRLSDTYHVVKLFIALGALIFITQAPMAFGPVCFFIGITLLVSIIGLILTQVESIHEVRK